MNRQALLCSCLVALAGSVCGWGCSTIARELDPAAARDEVRPGAFAGGADAPRVPRPEPEAGPVVAAGPELAARPSAPEAALTLRADPGIPGYTPAEPTREAVLIDAKVGDINGRPIFANAFFAPLEARLVAESERLAFPQWLVLAQREIGRSIDLMVTDELLRAEALADLKPEQRQGLRAWLETNRQRMISQSLGSEELARQRMAEQEGKSLEQILSEQEEEALVRLNIQELSRRVSVSWRDIEQRYERDFELYNPPPTARFRLIRVSTSNTAAVDGVARELASGVPFEEVAAGPLNTFNVDTQGLYEQAFGGAYEEHEFFGADELNTAAHGLTPGAWAGPIVFGSQTGWLKLESIERTSTTLYEAQLGIERELTLERRQAELSRYIERLIDRARVGNLNSIRQRLLDIAIERYAPSP